MPFSKFLEIKHFIFDIDGVLTSNLLQLNNDGTLKRNMNIKDGYAMQHAISKGYSISIISGAENEELIFRFKKLNITDVHLNIKDKYTTYKALIKSNNFNQNQILYMGDDIPDLQIMNKVFLPCCPLDACNEIKQIANYISPNNGGDGCVRDVIEKVMKLNNCWI